MTPLRYPDPLVRELEGAGFVPGRSLTIDYRQVEPDGKLGAVMAEVSRTADVIVAVGTPAVIAAFQTTRTVPIVMVAVPEPVKQGFVRDLARPEGNITGLSWPSRVDVLLTRLEHLREIVPGASTIRALSFGSFPHSAEFPDVIANAARTLRIRLRVIEVPRSGDLPRIFEAMKRESVGAVVVLADLFPYAARIVELAARFRLPTAYALRPAVEAGGLVSYGPEWDGLMRRAGWYVAQLLRGRKPHDFAVEAPTRYEFVINLTTAKTLGLTIPQAVLSRADAVIQ